ncbi:M20 family peptidase [Clostridium lacusfryxellense]|uniref:M20 family peptidase n=1 Tax=Clostridium lacusfryxellense TaxID=205328 RepID=UPI001C0B08D2|nr:M20 family peptidase [Clostridium lacusfryxellense]MBU3113153.1 M20 family peptidase [Clostridium lacusfryxellense]
MKQEIISYINSIKEDIYNLSTFLYTNPEINYKEYKACSYILNMLKANDFKIEENYCDIPTSFYAQYGTGHPKICYLCKYTSTENGGHIFGNNVNASMSIGAALGLSKVISKSGGSVIVVGCPGEYTNGSELTLTKDMCFEDMDVIIAPHCDINNAESGTSMATIPIKIRCKQSGTGSSNNFSSLDSYLLILSSISQLLKGLNNDCSIDNICITNASTHTNIFSESEVKFYLRASTLTYARVIEKTIVDLIHSMSQVVPLSQEISLFELPSQELLSNKSLSRIFTHNLKECGIIDITCCKDSLYGLGIGAVSHTTPCIYPSICITTNPLISCPSPLFALQTQTDFCKENIIKAAEALAITGLDVIEKQDLLKEIIIEHK